MSKLFWICTQCFKPQETPEEIVSNSLDAEKNVNEEDKSNIEIVEDILVPAVSLKLPEKEIFHRKKYEKRPKGIQQINVNLSNSDREMSIPNQRNDDNTINH